MSEEENKKKNPYTGWIIFVVIILGLTLPFHWSFYYGKVFPKEHLTFSNTFFSNNDVDEIIDRYNNASLYERQAINQEPFVRKLREKGIIGEENKNDW